MLYSCRYLEDNALTGESHAPAFGNMQSACYHRIGSILFLFFIIPKFQLGKQLKVGLPRRQSAALLGQGRRVVKSQGPVSLKAGPVMRLRCSGFASNDCYEPGLSRLQVFGQSGHGPQHFCKHTAALVGQRRCLPCPYRPVSSSCTDDGMMYAINDTRRILVVTCCCRPFLCSNLVSTMLTGMFWLYRFSRMCFRPPAVCLTQVLMHDAGTLPASWGSAGAFPKLYLL
jgi:hypothetical protein